MKISIDFDGTMWSHMAFFRELMKAMQAAGHQVGVLTGHRQESAEKDIDLMMARGFPRPDFYLGKPNEHYRSKNGAVFKFDMIREHGIDIHFDDFDYNNPDTDLWTERVAGAERHKVIRVQHREPTNVHYE